MEGSVHVQPHRNIEAVTLDSVIILASIVHGATSSNGSRNWSQSRFFFFFQFKFKFHFIYSGYETNDFHKKRV